MILFRNEEVRRKFHLLDVELQRAMQELAKRLEDSKKDCEIDFVSSEIGCEISFTLRDSPPSF